ncbi:MAG: hypothetical protein HC942_25940 [Microcoleus sp. SU_5_6]|nr:hypothetical protein [Microcoleus sp. SU_5_6]
MTIISFDRLSTGTPTACVPVEGAECGFNNARKHTPDKSHLTHMPQVRSLDYTSPMQPDTISAIGHQPLENRFPKSTLNYQLSTQNSYLPQSAQLKTQNSKLPNNFQLFTISRILHL